MASVLRSRYAGVTHLFTTDSSFLPAEGVSSCTDGFGRATHFWALPGARPTPYPQPAALDGEDRVTVLADGSLQVVSNTDILPELNVTREIAWEKTETGWIGHPQPLHLAWWLSSMLILMFVVWFLLRWRGFANAD